MLLMSKPYLFTRLYFVDEIANHAHDSSEKQNHPISGESKAAQGERRVPGSFPAWVCRVQSCVL